MARVALLQRNDDHQSMTVTPDAVNVRNSRLVQMIPDTGGIKRNAVALGDRQQRRIAEKDRVVAVKNSFHTHDALVAAVGIVAGPLAERTLRMRLFFRRWHLTFDNDFRAGGYRQTGMRSAHDFQRRAAQRAGVFVLAHAGSRGGRPRHPRGRLTAEHNGNRAGAAALPVFASDLFAVFLLNDPERDAIFA